MPSGGGGPGGNCDDACVGFLGCFGSMEDTVMFNLRDRLWS
ncbi:hypothetical protein RRSWK_05223 [Rhodopirellula sp. SWK7]|nr:hypothetical protein RRSWK_05223 [Rhodopirellula sp. SWK7]